MEKTSPNVMGVELKANPDPISGTNQRYIPGSVRFFSPFFTLQLLQRFGLHSVQTYDQFEK
jgi:hypothetical protein